MNTWIDKINAIVWGPPLLILLFVVGIYLTIRTRGIQFTHLFYALKLAFSRHDDDAEGDISHFQALMTSLAATIGIGSITGVATAIAIGGVGSLVWMWVAAVFGMATKYGEAILAIKYRVVDKNGEMAGGPMYYLERGLKSKWLAVMFAIAAAITAMSTGNMVQANSVALAVQDLFGGTPWITGVLLMAVVGIALIGGIKSIGRVTGYLVPAMAIFYILGGFIIICMRVTYIPAAFVLIFKSAFSGQAATGGFLGATVMLAVRMGVSRGIFSHEAGLGSSPIAAAAAKTDTPGRQALVSMCSVFITTGVVCTITGLVIAITGVLGERDASGAVLNGSAMALRAFDAVIPKGGLIVTIALIPFAYSTILGWGYYGERCVEYLFGILGVKIYRVLFTLIVFPGAILSLETVWGISNILNAFMAFPNLIGLFCLAGVVATETKIFRRILAHEKST
jgi:alanine or glycine:cation symporter, AGCS family